MPTQGLPMSYPNFEIVMKACKFKNFELWQNFSPFAIAKRSTQQRLTMFRSLVDQIDIDDQNPPLSTKKGIVDSFEVISE